MIEKNENPKPSITVNGLMDYVEGQLENNQFTLDDLDKIINGVWDEKTSCTVSQHRTFDDVQRSRIINYCVADAFYELFILMQKNDLTLQDLECYPYCCMSSSLEPIIYFEVKTKEHEYKYYPIMLKGQRDSEKDEYTQIKNRVGLMKADIDSNYSPDHN